MVAHKEVVLAVFGASTALAGLILVFLGFLIATYQSYPSDTSARILNRYRRALLPVLTTFFLALLDAFLALVWLLTGGDALYWAGVVLFGVAMGLLFVSAVNVTRIIVF